VKVTGVNNNINFNNSVPKSEQVQPDKKAVIQDKLEISNKAKELQSNKVKDPEVIKQRIADKFYDSDEVLNKVASKVLKDIK
jgi:hypothetical protein